jgi:hypothetical protein
MGNFNAKGLDVNRFSQISLAKIWEKHCKSHSMGQTEFAEFIFSLSSGLGIEIDTLDIGIIFNKLQKAGLVGFEDFSMNFDSWSNQKIEEISGVEVLEPRVNFTLITKYYQLELPLNTTIHKRFPFHNPDPYEKSLKLSSSIPKLLKIRTPLLKLEANSTEYIRVSFKIEFPSQVLLFLSHFSTDLLEETLSFNLIPMKTSDLEVQEIKPTKFNKEP